MEGVMSNVGIWITSALVGLVVVVSGCGSSEADGTTSSQREEASPSPSADNEVKLVEGRFDVGGHKLYLRCTGEGSPTVVYLHGYIFDPSGGDSSNSGQIPSLLEDENRVCIYDRANVGQSDSVKGPLTGKSSIQDLHALLDAAKDRGSLRVGRRFFRRTLGVHVFNNLPGRGRRDGLVGPRRCRATTQTMTGETRSRKSISSRPNGRR